MIAKSYLWSENQISAEVEAKFDIGLLLLVLINLSLLILTVIWFSLHE